MLLKKLVVVEDGMIIGITMGAILDRESRGLTIQGKYIENGHYFTILKKTIPRLKSWRIDKMMCKALSGEN